MGVVKSTGWLRLDLLSSQEVQVICAPGSDHSQGTVSDNCDAGLYSSLVQPDVNLDKELVSNFKSHSASLPKKEFANFTKTESARFGQPKSASFLTAESTSLTKAESISLHKAESTSFHEYANFTQAESASFSRARSANLPLGNHVNFGNPKTTSSTGVKSANFTTAKSANFPVANCSNFTQVDLAIIRKSELGHQTRPQLDPAKVTRGEELMDGKYSPERPHTGGRSKSTGSCIRPLTSGPASGLPEVGGGGEGSDITGKRLSSVNRYSYFSYTDVFMFGKPFFVQ